MKAVLQHHNLLTIVARSLALSLICGIAVWAQKDLPRGIPPKPSSPGGSPKSSPGTRTRKVERKNRSKFDSRTAPNTDNPVSPPPTAPSPGLAEKDEGIASYNKQEYDAAIERLNAAKTHRPDDAEIFYYLGDSYSAKEQYKEAIGAYEKAMQKAELQATAEQYFYLGYAYEVTKDNTNARKYYDKAIAKKADYSDAWTHLGDVYSQQKDWKAAIAAYQRAYDLDPKIVDAEVWFNWGYAYVSSSIWDKSIEKFEKAIEFKIDNMAEAYFLLGMGFKNNRRFPEAIDAFKNQLKIKADDDYAFWAQMHLGDIYSQDFEPYNWEAALDAYQGAVRLNDKHPLAWSNLGVVQHNLKKLNFAADSYQRAVMLDPLNAGYHLDLGKEQAKLERYSEAIGTLNKAVELDPKLSEAYYYRGYSYKLLGQYELAVASLAKGLEIGFKERRVEGNARYNLAVSYEKLGNVAAKREQCELLRSMPSGAPSDSAGVCK